VLVLPWLALTILMPILAAVVAFSGVAIWVHLAVSTGIFLFKNLCFFLWAQQKFRREFRTVAARGSDLRQGLTGLLASVRAAVPVAPPSLPTNR
jgi:hypothetical protein